VTKRYKVKFSKGPMVYLEALATGDPELIAEALEFQRESFRAQVGCYPEELRYAECKHLIDECPCHDDDEPL
jgi:hypothetical protein